MAASAVIPKRADAYVPGRSTITVVENPPPAIVPKARLVSKYSSGEHCVFHECPVCHTLVSGGLDTGGSVNFNNYRQHFVDEHINHNTKKGSVMAKGSTEKTDEIRKQREAAANKRAGTANGDGNGEAKPAKPAKPELAPIVQKDLIAAIGEYVNSAGSSEPEAPMNGTPFVQKNRVFMQLAGRGGVGKGADVESGFETGLLPFLRAQGSTMAASKRQLQGALSDLGFNRSPFAYVHPDRGSTAASYYSAPTSTLKGVKITLVERVGKREVAKAEKDAEKAAAEAAKAETADTAA